MAAAATAKTSTCAKCGAALASASSPDLGCMVCLLQLASARSPAAFDGDPPLEQFGQYVIEKREDGRVWELGRGAMGVTYRATDSILQRTVALKIISIDRAPNAAAARERFLREARAAAALRHPNIATVHQFGIHEESGQCFYAMELIEGETLEERVRRKGPCAVSMTIAIARQVANALLAAETRGLVHRDIKPGNLMMIDGGDETNFTIKVIDFGVAKALAATPQARELTHGGFVGTPAFASPEQFTEAPVDVRSDIYSLGATLWYLLTGHLPFGDRAGGSAPPIEQLKAAHVPPAFISLLASMLAIQPAARPGVRELGTRLEALRGRRRAVMFAIAAIVIAGAAAAFYLHASRLAASSEKSIAVLPFENSSDEKANAYFVSGIHDDLLVNLSKIANLKVISRDSVMPYRTGARDLRAIGKELGTRTVVEGSVRREGTRAHINVQLINAADGRQMWAENYDREVADVFTVQREIAESVASELNAALSPGEKTALQQQPTQDLEAYDMYLQARALFQPFGVTAKTVEENLPKAEHLLQAAIARDPRFVLAYCLLSEVQATPAWAENQSPEQRAKSEATLQRAVEIAPDSGEVHLALARHYYHPLELQYSPPPDELRLVLKKTEDQLAIAARKLPGTAEIFTVAARIAHDRGQFKKCLRQWRKATEIDPRNPEVASNLADVLAELRDYSAAEKLLDRAIAGLPPQSTGSLWRQKSRIALDRGDTTAAMNDLDASPNRNMGLAGLNHEVANVMLMQRRYDEAATLMDSLGEIARAHNALPRSGINHYAQGLYSETIGMIARAQGKTEKARGAFEASRKEFEGWLAQRPDEPTALADRAVAIAGLGEHDEAMREIAHAGERWPMARDPVLAARVATSAAIVYSWLADREVAIRQLQAVVKLPGGPSPGGLRVDPRWDELRSDPRFAAIVAEAAQPPNYN
jgi:eukaryotic-like serine/threonine-protein kinase